MANRCRRRPSPRGRRAARAALRRRSSSSRSGSQWRRASRAVSGEGARSRRRQAADREVSQEAAASSRSRSVRAGQRERKSVRRRWACNRWAAWRWTWECVRVYCMERKPPSWNGSLCKSHSQDGACVHLPSPRFRQNSLGTTETCCSPLPSGGEAHREINVDSLCPRCAGIDVHKNNVVVCVRCCDRPGKVAEEIRTFSTMTADLLALSDWLAERGVTHAAMEST